MRLKKKIRKLVIRKLQAEIQILHYESILRGMRVDKEKDEKNKKKD